MKREIDFEMLAEKINDSDLYEFVAFSNDVPVRAITGIWIPLKRP